MPHAQSGICAEANLHGVYLFLNVLDGQEANVTPKLSHILALQEKYDNEFSEALVSSVVAIGTQYWPHIFPSSTPKTLAGFPQFEHLEHSMPSRPIDLMVQIRADRLDVVHLFVMAVIELLGSDVELIEHITCFHFLDGRDLNGFTYGVTNPHGRLKNQVALVGEDDAEFSQGSYIHVQRFHYDLPAWQEISLAEQEIVMGRTAITNEPASCAVQNSHSLRTELNDEQGNALYLNQSMPFADINRQGSLFICCANNGYAFQTLLKHRLGYTDDDGPDMWLEFAKSDFGAAFFAPSVNILKDLASPEESI